MIQCRQFLPSINNTSIKIESALSINTYVIQRRHLWMKTLYSWTVLKNTDVGLNKNYSFYAKIQRFANFLEIARLCLFSRSIMFSLFPISKYASRKCKYRTFRSNPIRIRKERVVELKRKEVLESVNTIPLWMNSMELWTMKLWAMFVEIWAKELWIMELWTMEIWAMKYEVSKFELWYYGLWKG